MSAAVAYASAQAYAAIGKGMSSSIVEGEYFSIRLDPTISATEGVFLHGAVGGFASAMQGGKFSSGFISGAVGKATTLGIADNIQNVVGKGIVVSISGGIAAELGGGKFSNGARTAAMGYLLNEMNSNRSNWAKARSKSNKLRTVNKLIYTLETFELAVSVDNPGSDEIGPPIGFGVVITKRIQLFAKMAACCVISSTDSDEILPLDLPAFEKRIGFNMSNVSTIGSVNGVYRTINYYEPGDLCPATCQSNNFFRVKTENPLKGLRDTINFLQNMN